PLPRTILLSALTTHYPHPELHTLSLHDALPIYNMKNFLSSAFRQAARQGLIPFNPVRDAAVPKGKPPDTYAYSVHEVAVMVKTLDRKSTRLNSSHGSISYAVFCFKKKDNNV